MRNCHCGAPIRSSLSASEFNQKRALAFVISRPHCARAQLRLARVAPEKLNTGTGYANPLNAGAIGSPPQRT